MSLTRIQPAALDVTLNYRANNFTANGFTFADGTTQTTAAGASSIGIINTNTVLSSTKFILASNTITLTLPTAVGISGTSYTIKNVGDGQITVIGQSGQTIDTNTSMILAYKYSVIGLVSDGTNWQIF
jgi:hypothetical protein